MSLSEKSKKIYPEQIVESSYKRGDPSVDIMRKVIIRSEQKLHRLREDWHEIEWNLSEFKQQGWKSFIEQVERINNTSNNRVSLTEFRKALDIFLKEICSTQLEHNKKCSSKCISSGSTDITSDIDVTITGNCLETNFFHLEALRNIFSSIFSSGRFFRDEYDNFQINRVFYFFDINFYISNFAIKKRPLLPDNRLSSYWVSTSTKQLHVINEQGKLYGIDKLNTNAEDLYDFYKTTILDLNEFFIQVEERRNASLGIFEPNEFPEVQSYKRQRSSILNVESTFQNALNTNNENAIANAIVDAISLVATMEDECYVSQGAFFHVVMMMQRGIKFVDAEEEGTYEHDVLKFMMVCSILENLRFSIHHPGKSRGKYLIRVLDANLYLDTTLQTKLSSFLQDITIKSNISNDEIYDLQSLRRNKSTPELKQRFLSLEDSLKTRLASLETEFIQQLYDALYQYVASDVYTDTSKPMTGGKLKLKPLLSTSTKQQVKKMVAGKNRLVYIDAKRRQYTKQKGNFVSVRPKN